MVLERVFGQQGILRRHGITAILATHSPNHTRLADRVFNLEGGKLIEQNHTAWAISSREAHNQPTGTHLNVQPTVGGNSVANALELPNDVPQLHARGLGDASVYRYYFNAIGMTYTVLFFTFQTLRAFLTAFPSKLFP